MLTHPTIEQLRALKLDGMAEAFIELQAAKTQRRTRPCRNGWRYCLIERRPAAAQGDTGPDCAPPNYATVRPRLRMWTLPDTAPARQSSLPAACHLPLDCGGP